MINNDFPCRELCLDVIRFIMQYPERRITFISRSWNKIFESTHFLQLGDKKGGKARAHVEGKTAALSGFSRGIFVYDSLGAVCIDENSSCARERKSFPRARGAAKERKGDIRELIRRNMVICP